MYYELIVSPRYPLISYIEALTNPQYLQNVTVFENSFQRGS